MAASVWRRTYSAIRYTDGVGTHQHQMAIVHVPTAEGNRPEAEWGFEPALRDDLERFARARGYRIRRIVFQEPEHLSPFVAELYRWWYKQRKILANRVLVESFILVEPMWALRTGERAFLDEVQYGTFSQLASTVPRKHRPLR